MIFCFYSGHGLISGAGTNHINLLDSEDGYAFEDKIREFSEFNRKNSYMVGFLNCCRDVKGYVETYLSQEVRPNRPSDGNLILIFSCPPNKKTAADGKTVKNLV